ncbi:MAG: bifunctional oligoribonuclease and phosphatase NrnA [Clostridia bacterium]|jgi:phosphoesterase RecJ-like protein|nr:bifunctional oligoribonuclease and phosphatase NrnA [Clostridia bacterium]MDN5323256.1 bifunctional oligoribonuclease and phosphatase NrnA [Clostridia bacterium]
MEDILKIKDLILESEEITIVSHYHPDGDTLGSQIALALGLEQLGKKTVLINKNPIPNYYQFLSNWQNIKPLDQIEKLSKIIICVDCATLERTGYDLFSFKKRESILINIDHHISNTNFAQLNWVDAQAASTAELIYDLLGLLQIKIDEKIATALYTGISTDTGSFLYENTTPTTHIVVADLLNRGANVNLVRTNYYENVSISKLKLLKYGLNNLFFAAEEKIAWITINRETFISSGASDGDAEGLINYIKNIAGVEIAIIFREISSEKIKVSMRSKTWVDVNKLASSFGGGGHPRAAGCIIFGQLDQVVEKVTASAMKSIAQGGAN